MGMRPPHKTKSHHNPKRAIVREHCSDRPTMHFRAQFRVKQTFSFELILTDPKKTLILLNMSAILDLLDILNFMYWAWYWHQACSYVLIWSDILTYYQNGLPKY